MISFDEAEAVTSLDVSAKGSYDVRYHIIKSLEGIEAFINLDSLNCHTQDSLTELDLSNNPGLKYLSLDVSKKTALEELDLYENPSLGEVRV